jgi:hypothetical protein
MTFSFLVVRLSVGAALDLLVNELPSRGAGVRRGRFASDERSLAGWGFPGE